MTAAPGPADTAVARVVAYLAAHDSYPACTDTLFSLRPYEGGPSAVVTATDLRAVLDALAEAQKTARRIWRGETHPDGEPDWLTADDRSRDGHAGQQDTDTTTSEPPLSPPIRPWRPDMSRTDYTISPYGRANCPACGREFNLTAKGVLRVHVDASKRGEGWGKPICKGAGHFPSPESVRYWTIWTADRREVIGQVAGPGLIDTDAALAQAADSAYDFEHTKANSYVEETDETGFNLLHDWDALMEDEKADLRPAVASPPSIAERRRRLDADIEDARKALVNAQAYFDRLCNESAALRREEQEADRG